MMKLTLFALAVQCLAISLGSATATAQVSNYMRDSVLPYMHAIPARFIKQDSYSFDTRGGAVAPMFMEPSANAYAINLRGNLIMVDRMPGNVQKPWFAKIFPQFDLHQGHQVTKDSSSGSGMQGYYVYQNGKSKKEQQPEFHYFVQVSGDSVEGVKYIGNAANAQPLVKEVAMFLANNPMPDSVLSDLNNVQTMPLAGRNVPLQAGACRWMDPGSLQCADYGQISWTLHPTEAEATKAMNDQIALNKTKKGIDVTAETDVSVLFEDVATIAHKKEMKLKAGVVGVMAGLPGSNMLNVYYLVAEVRGRWVYCMLSHWKNNSTGDKLPPSLESVMKLK
ncbi:MAG: hypothetical protein EOP51_09850 [Sphingobacteriales bacterium]|nr:MAG: hypothetical protein EOP51_09850 [Sphingobacteriales bacterium]